jgi:hypothetical protein
MAEGEVAPTCDGVIIHPGTPKEERLTFADAHLRGIEVEDPGIQARIDGAGPGGCRLRGE